MPWWKRWGAMLLVLLYGLLGTLYSLAVPLFEAPDEIWHYSFIHTMARDRTLPVQPTGQKDVWLREAGQPPLYHILGAVVTALFDTSDFPGFVRFNDVHPAISPGSESTAPNVFIHTHSEAFPYRGSVLVVHILRLLGVLWGCGTIVGVYRVGREILPDVGLALVATALVGFNPHFIFISSVINNDIAAACLCTWGLYLCIRLVRQPARMRTSLFLGVVLGLALLSKMSALALLALVALALGLAWWQDRDWRAFLLRSGIVGGLSLAVAGWWYVRNWVLYGDPLGWSIWLQDIGVQRITLDELIRQFGDVFVSYWEPVAGLFPAPVFWFLGVLLALAAVGWVRMLVRALPTLSSRRRSSLRLAQAPGDQSADLEIASLPTVAANDIGACGESARPRAAPSGTKACPTPLDVIAESVPIPSGWLTRNDRSPGWLGVGGQSAARGLLLAGTWFILLFASLIRYMTTTPSAAGRLLYPGVASLAVWMVVGWSEWLPLRRGKVVWGLVVGALLVLSIATPVLGIIPLYARPVSDSVEAQFPMNNRFGEIELVGIDVTPERVEQGDTAFVTLYWRVLAPPPQDLRVVVRLWSLGGQLLGQCDQVPAGEIYPPDLWRTGEIVRDTYRVVVSGVGPARCQAMVNVRAGETSLGGMMTPDLCTLLPSPWSSARVSTTPSYRLGEQIELVGYHLVSDDPSQLTATLYWLAKGPVGGDYNVFVHVMDGNGLRVGHQDGPPLKGDYPTSVWDAGELLADVHTIPVADGIPADGYLLVGLYRLEDGQRLPAYTETGERFPDDAIRIDLREIIQ